MQIQVFSIPVYDNQAMTDEMNSVLRKFKIIDIERQFVEQGFNSFWTVCVRYVENSQAQESEFKKPKIDYREVLDEKTFEIYARLRDIRKKIAEDEKIKVYAVFTNEELANIARLSAITKENMLTIKGIGDKKVEKYGNFFVNQEKKPV